MYFWLKIKKFRKFLSRGPPRAQYRVLKLFFSHDKDFLGKIKKISFSNNFGQNDRFPEMTEKRFSLRLPPCEPKNLLVSLVMTWLFQKLNLEFYTLHHRWYIYFVNNNLVFVNYPDSYPLHIKHVFSLNKIFLLPECIKGGFAFHFDAEKWVANGGVGARHQSERRPDFKGGATSLAHKWKNTMVQGHSTIESFDKLFKKFQTCPKMTATR